MPSTTRTLVAACVLALVLGAAAVRASIAEQPEPAVELTVLDVVVGGDPVADLLLEAQRPEHLVDSFEGTAALGESSGIGWVDLGNWRTADGTAVLRPRPDGVEPYIAVIDGPTGERLVQVTMATVDGGAGLLVAYRDAANYWAVVATPAFASWQVWQVVDGRAGVVATLGPLAPIEDGVEVAVHITEDHMDFLLDGIRFARVNHRTEPDATGVGLAAMRPTLAAWDDFVVVGRAAP